MLAEATQATPAIHPRLGDPALWKEAAATWRNQGYLRIESALEPGLAAELAHLLNHVPSAAGIDEARAELAWRGRLQLPEYYEAQHSACLWRLVRALEQDLPPIVEGITGRPLRVREPRALDVVALRKGSFADLPREAPATEVTWWLGLSPGTWPAEWGGHLELVDEDGVSQVRFPPGWDTLDLFDERWRTRVPLVKRPVEGVWVRGALTC